MSQTDRLSNRPPRQNASSDRDLSSGDPFVSLRDESESSSSKSGAADLSQRKGPTGLSVAASPRKRDEEEGGADGSNGGGEANHGLGGGDSVESKYEILKAKVLQRREQSARHQHSHSANNNKKFDKDRQKMKICCTYPECVLTSLSLLFVHSLLCFSYFSLYSFFFSFLSFFILFFFLLLSCASGPVGGFISLSPLTSPVYVGASGWLRTSIVASVVLVLCEACVLESAPFCFSPCSLRLSRTTMCRSHIRNSS